MRIAWAFALAVTLVACADDSLHQLPNPPVAPEGAGDRPVAVIEPVDFAYATPSTVHLDGRSSYDPDGAVVGYAWRVVSAPTGSANVPQPAGGATADFVVGLAGAYTLGLRVEDDEGNVSDEATVSFEASASAAIHVELTWDYNDNDVDLHLVRGSAPVADPFDDCYYGTCVGAFNMLDWGVPGDSSDDPSLDLDNIGDVVPENINLDYPAAGDYRVVVNYFADAGMGAAHPSVRIFIDGALAATLGPVTLNASCAKWRVGTIRIPAGQVVPDGSVYSDLVDCYDGF